MTHVKAPAPDKIYTGVISSMLRGERMPIIPNPLSEMADLGSNVTGQDERPNASFASKVLPGFQQAVKGRRAIRIFDGVPIPQDIMRNFLSDAILSPRASNLQTYEFHWLRDTEKKKGDGRLLPWSTGGHRGRDNHRRRDRTPEGLFSNRVRFPFDDLAKEV